MSFSISNFIVRNKIYIHTINNNLKLLFFSIITTVLGIIVLSSFLPNGIGTISQCPKNIGKLGSIIFLGKLLAHCKKIISDLKQKSLYSLNLQLQQQDVQANLTLQDENILQIPHQILQKIHDHVEATQLMTSTIVTMKLDREVPYHNIMNGLFLGRNTAFIQTIANKKHFDAIITACPMGNIFKDLPENKIQECALVFQQQHVQWHYIGKMLQDSQSYWPVLVYNCTFFDTHSESSVDQKSNTHLPTMFQTEVQALRQISVRRWFAPIFQEMDHAVFNNKRVLVHCKLGCSRSAAIVTAYIMNRFDVTMPVALNFLKSKRACVAPNFIPGLLEYERALRATK